MKGSTYFFTSKWYIYYSQKWIIVNTVDIWWQQTWPIWVHEECSIYSIYYYIQISPGTLQVIIQMNFISTHKHGGTRWRSWLRHCATSRKIEGSIPDGVIRILLWHNTSGHTMALGVDTASNRNEYQEYFRGGKGSRCIWLTTLPPSCANCLEIWEPQPPGTLRACPGL